MKKNYFKLFVSAFLLFNTLYVTAQTLVTIPSTNTGSAGASVNVARKPYGTTRAFERSAMKFTQAEIGLLGTITDIAFYCDSINSPGNVAVKIYLKEVPDSEFVASTVAAEETGATLVYEDTILAASFVKDTWVNITLSNPFSHFSNSNVEVIIETNSGGTAGTDLTTLSKSFRYTTFTNNRFQYWQSQTGSGNAPTGNGFIGTSRSNVQFIITPLPACIAPPTAGITVASNTAVCAGESVALSLLGNSVGLGLSFQWYSSPDSINWLPISGAVQANYSAVITSAEYFTCIVTCSGVNDTANAIGITLNSFINCYCTANLGGNCATTAIDSVAIVSTTFNNPNTDCAATFYTAYPASGNTTASLVQGQSYTFVTRYTGDVRTSLWIDYNHSGTYEGNEWTQLCTTALADSNVFTNVTLPITALTGMTGMRIRSRSSAGVNDSTTACSTFGTGETEDYMIDITAASACTAPPTAGNVVASATALCSGLSSNLSLIGNSSGLGISYQWLSSTDSLNWLQVSGATQNTYSPVVTSTLYYTCITTCSGSSDTAAAVLVTLNPFYLCYCSSGLGGNCNGNAIDSVAIFSTALANGPTGCSPGDQIVYPATGNTTADLTQGQTYNFITKYIGNERASVWIDYNRDGIFDITEWNQLCTSSVQGTEVITAINIPITAGAGLTGMRIRSRGNTGQNDSSSACANFLSGEIEDYFVNIVAALPCTTPPNAGTTASTSALSVCSGSPVNLSLIGNDNGLGMTFQWESSPDGITYNPIVGETLSVYNFVATAAGYYSCRLTCSGISATSIPLQITIAPFINCYCTSGLGGNCATTAIDSLALNTLVNGPSGCSPTNYTSYPVSGTTTTTLVRGTTYALTAKFNGDLKAVAWIDYDHNGTFDVSEGLQICNTATADTDVVASLTVPMTAMLGLTGLRIRTRSVQGQNDSTTACTAFGTGETEDYFILIDSIPLSVATLSKLNSIHVYPNPIEDELNVMLLNNEEVELVVYDLTARKLIQESFVKSITVTTSKLAKGVYLYEIKNKSGMLKTGKLVKK